MDENFSELEGRRLKGAVVGMGKMGILYMSILNFFEDVEIPLVCEKSSVQKPFLGDFLPESKIIKSVENIPDLYFVYVTVSIPSHLKVLRKIALNSNIQNVFVEKTAVSSPAEFKEVKTLSANLEGIFAIGYHRRYSSTFVKAKEMIENDEIGEPKKFKTRIYSNNFLHLDERRAIEASEKRGGLIRDLASHGIDICSWYFGDFEVLSVYRNLFGDFPRAVKVKMKTGNVDGELKASWCKKGFRIPEVSLTLEGEKGKIFVNDYEIILEKGDFKKKLYRHDMDQDVEFLLGSPEYYREDRDFLASIFKEGNPKVNFDKTVHTEKIIRKIEEQTQG